MAADRAAAEAGRLIMARAVAADDRGQEMAVRRVALPGTASKSVGSARRTLAARN